MHRPTWAVADRQFCHSSATSNMWYGIHNTEMCRMREHILHSFREVSSKWHALLKGRKCRLCHDTTRLTAPSLLSTSTTLAIQSLAVVPLVSSTTAIPSLSSSTLAAGFCIAPPSSSPTPGHLNVQSNQQQYVTTEQSAESLKYLRFFCGDAEVKFRSCEQAAAVNYTIHTKCDVVVVLPTGCGKSLLFFLYAEKHRSVTSVVVVPSVSLRCDLMRRAKSRGISCTDELDSFRDENLVFVTPEAAVGAQFRKLLMNLCCADRLGRIFVDEAHLFPTDSKFRPAFRQLPQLTFMPVPFVFMTATAPQWIVEDISASFFGAFGRKPLLFQQPTSRTNISYRLTKDSRDAKCVAEHCLMVLATYANEDRCIVFVPSIELVIVVQETLSNRHLPCVTYTGRQEEENASSFASWREGSVTVVVATSCFGVGIDYSHVCDVVIFGLPYSLEDYAQQSGRAGRDGKPARALLMYDLNREYRKSWNK